MSSNRWSPSLTAVALLCALVPIAACSSSGDETGSGGSSASAGPGAGPGSGGGSGQPELEELTEEEPNDGPDFAGFQDIGRFEASRTVRISGRLDSGGNDGASYTGDLDVFAFDVAAAGGQLALSVDWEGSADVDAAIYDANLVAVGAEGTTAKPISSTGAMPTGTFALALFSKDAPAEYTLTLTYTVGSGEGGACASPLQESEADGCTFTMNDPANGAALTLPVLFGWRSDGCETPGKVYFYGNPPTETNWISFDYVRGGQESLLNVAGEHLLTEADLAGIVTSDNGLYHWQLESFHGHRSPGRTFTIGGATCD